MDTNHTDGNNRILALSCLCAVLGLAACQPDGSAEKTGKKIDQILEKQGKQLESAKQDVAVKAESVKESVAAKAEAVKESVAVDSHIAGEYIDDAAITAKIKETLLADDALKSLQIEVTTVNGVVTLRGAVESEQMIGRAVGLANSQKNVKSVQNELTLKVDAVVKQ